MEHSDEVRGLLEEFSALCHEHYIAQSAALLGLNLLQKQHANALSEYGSGQMAHVSSPSDLASATPPMSRAVPHMDLERYKKSLEPDGDFFQYQKRALLVFIYQTWENYIRPRIAGSYGVKPVHIGCDLMGDLRHVRDDIIHRQGRVDVKNLPLMSLSQIWIVGGDEWNFSDREIRLLVDQLSVLQVFAAEPSSP